MTDKTQQREIRITAGDPSAGADHQIATVFVNGKARHRFVLLPGGDKGDSPTVLAPACELARVLGIPIGELNKASTQYSYPAASMRAIGDDWPSIQRLLGLGWSNSLAPGYLTPEWQAMFDAWQAVIEKTRVSVEETWTAHFPIFHHVISRVDGVSLVTYWRDGQPFWIARDIPLGRSKTYVLTLLSHQEGWAKGTVDGVHSVTCDEALRFYQRQQGLHVCRVNAKLLLRPGMERLLGAFPQLARHIEQATGETWTTAETVCEPAAVPDQPPVLAPDLAPDLDLDAALDRAIERAMPRILEAVSQTVQQAVQDAATTASQTVQGDLRTAIRKGAHEMMRLLVLSTSLQVGVPDPK